MKLKSRITKSSINVCPNDNNKFIKNKRQLISICLISILLCTSINTNNNDDNNFNKKGFGLSGCIACSGGACVMERIISNSLKKSHKFSELKNIDASNININKKIIHNTNKFEPSTIDNLYTTHNNIDDAMNFTDDFETSGSFHSKSNLAEINETKKTAKNQNIDNDYYNFRNNISTHNEEVVDEYFVKSNLDDTNNDNNFRSYSSENIQIADSLRNENTVDDYYFGDNFNKMKYDNKFSSNNYNNYNEGNQISGSKYLKPAFTEFDESNEIIKRRKDYNFKSNMFTHNDNLNSKSYNQNTHSILSQSKILNMNSDIERNMKNSKMPQSRLKNSKITEKKVDVIKTSIKIEDLEKEMNNKVHFNISSLFSNFKKNSAITRESIEKEIDILNKKNKGNVRMKLLAEGLYIEMEIIGKSFSYSTKIDIAGVVAAGSGIAATYKILDSTMRVEESNNSND